MEFTILLLTMLLLTLAGIPLMYSILLSSFGTILLFLPDVPLSIVSQQFMQGINSSALQALAFFFLAGELMSMGGITSRIIRFASSFMGSIKGSIAYINIVSSMLFGCISGSAVASTAAIGSALIPEMTRRGYSKPFSAALTQVASIMGPIIPPSIPMIVFATLAGSGVSVGAMFVAGIVPGIVIACALTIATLAISLKRNYGDEYTAFSWKALVSSGKDAILAILCPLIILGGILSGVFTATEAGAVAVIYAYGVGAFIYKELDLSALYKALCSSLRGTASIMLIVGASSIFAWLVARLRISHDIAEWIRIISTNPLQVLLVINGIVFFTGMVMDPIAALTILVPVFMPIVREFGISPIHFGVVLILNLMIGLITPPVGYLIYLSADLAQTGAPAVLKESIPYLLTLLAVLILIVLIPGLSTGLPQIFFPGAR